jgi:hypothetical protein
LVVLILFGAYTGYCFAPALFSKSGVSRVIESTFEKADYEISDEAIRNSIIRGASASSLTLEDENISIQRDTYPGERVVRVDVSYSVPVSYLGSERTMTPNVHHTTVFEVDEAEVVRRNKRRQQDEARKIREQAEYEGRAQRERERLIRGREECEKWAGKGNCIYKGN